MRLTYLFDPLCGWCYGAAPALDQIAGLDGVTLELAPTGLFAGSAARPMDAAFAAYAWHNDQRIARLTGQRFSEAYRTRVLGAGGGLFDSAPATLGIVAAGLTGDAYERVALKALQRARYLDGFDNCNLVIVADVLVDAGLAEAAERIRAPDEELLTNYRDRIDAARAEMARFGVNGVPALVIGEKTQRRLLPGKALFGDIDDLKAQIRDQ